MNADRLYQELKDLSERLGIEVSEQNFRATGIKARSGYCVVKGKPVYLIDKNKRLQHRIQVISEFLAEKITEDDFMVPTVREHLARYKPKKPMENQPQLFPSHSDNNN